jgi:hypothetical protein
MTMPIMMPEARLMSTKSQQEEMTMIILQQAVRTMMVLEGNGIPKTKEGKKMQWKKLFIHSMKAMEIFMTLLSKKLLTSLNQVT